MISLTIALITARKEPLTHWFVDSLIPQIKEDDKIQVIVCDLDEEGITPLNQIYKTLVPNLEIVLAEPKPCVWSGRLRLTNRNCWSKANSINSAICLAKHETFSAVDDRCILGPDWLNAVRQSVGSYVVCGSYEKRHNMKVESGKMIDGGTLHAEDGRQIPRGLPTPCQGASMFGCTWASPLEWLLNINGADERLDGSSAEDTMMGMQFVNAGYPLKYDSRMFVTQDRTPGESGPDIFRSSRQRYQYDKQDRLWKALSIFAKESRANHHHNLRDIRANLASGGTWPGIDTCPKVDWWNGLPIQEWDNAV